LRNIQRHEASNPLLAFNPHSSKGDNKMKTERAYQFKNGEDQLFDECYWKLKDIYLKIGVVSTLEILEEIHYRQLVESPFRKDKDYQAQISRDCAIIDKAIDELER